MTSDYSFNSSTASAQIGAPQENPAALLAGVDDISQPIDVDGRVLTDLYTAPTRDATTAQLVQAAIGQGLIGSSIVSDGGRSRSYKRIDEFHYKPITDLSPFKALHVDEHVATSLGIFERLERNRTAWCELLEKAFYVETELIQFSANEEIYEREVYEGLYVTPYREAVNEAEARRAELQHAQQAAFQLASTLDQKYRDFGTELNIEEMSAWMSALSTYKEDRPQADFNLGTVDVGIGTTQGKKPLLAQKLARKSKQMDGSFGYAMMLVDKIAHVGDALAKKERFDAAKTRMEWEAHNQVFRRDRADVARSATMSKAAAYSQPGGALNFREQMDGLAKRIAVDLREIMARAFAIQTGMKSVYGIGVDWPTVYQAGDGTHFATLPRIDDLYAWLRNCATEIERFRQQDQNYILPISLRTLLGETGWKQALDSSTTRFYINPDLFPDQAHVRLRGVRAFTYGTQQADGYWGARLILPTRVRSRDMTGVTTVRDQDSLPAIRFPRMGARTAQDNVEFVGTSALANACPVSGDASPFGAWSIDFPVTSTQRVDRKKIEDIEIELAVATRYRQ